MDCVDVYFNVKRVNNVYCLCKDIQIPFTTQIRYPSECFSCMTSVYEFLLMDSWQCYQQNKNQHRNLFAGKFVLFTVLVANASAKWVSAVCYQRWQVGDFSYLIRWEVLCCPPQRKGNVIMKFMCMIDRYVRWLLSCVQQLEQKFELSLEGLDV